MFQASPQTVCINRSVATPGNVEANIKADFQKGIHKSFLDINPLEHKGSVSKLRVQIYH